MADSQRGGSDLPPASVEEVWSRLGGQYRERIASVSEGKRPAYLAVFAARCALRVLDRLGGPSKEIRPVMEGLLLGVIDLCWSAPDAQFHLLAELLRSDRELRRFLASPIEDAALFQAVTASLDASECVQLAALRQEPLVREPALHAALRSVGAVALSRREPPAGGRDWQRVHQEQWRDLEHLTNLLPDTPLWSGRPPAWHDDIAEEMRSLRSLRPSGELTDPTKRSNLLGMPEQEHRSTRAGGEEGGKKNADASGSAPDDFDQAFGRIELPLLVPASFERLTPQQAFEVMAGLEDYLRRAGDAVVGELRRVLRGLEGQALPSLEKTKEFAARLQNLLDRSGYGIECPSCQQIGRYEGAAHHAVDTGALRIRHGNKTSHKGATVVTELPLKPLP